MYFVLLVYWSSLLLALHSPADNSSEQIFMSGAAMSPASLFLIKLLCLTYLGSFGVPYEF